MKKLILFIFIVCQQGLAAPSELYRADRIAPPGLGYPDINPRFGIVSNGYALGAVTRPDTALINHVLGTDTPQTPGQMGTDSGARSDSAYVSTTTSLNVAHIWVNFRFSGMGWIYVIQPAPNLIDVNATLGRYSIHATENEYAALERIPWSQVRGWLQVRNGVMDSNMTRNPAYRPNLYRNLSVGGAQYQLAFPPDDPKWSEAPWRDYAPCGPTSQSQRAAVSLRALDKCDQTDDMLLSALKFTNRFKYIVYIKTWLAAEGII